jgi:hypothetical protein
MTGTAYIQPQSDEAQDWQQLSQENGSLRAIIGELLSKNQKLRWELQEARMLAGSRPQAFDGFRGDAVTQESPHSRHAVARAQ